MVTMTTQPHSQFMVITMVTMRTLHSQFMVITMVTLRTQPHSQFMVISMVTMRAPQVTSDHDSNDNNDNTTVTSVHGDNNNTEDIIQMDWNPPKFKILGVWLTVDLTDCKETNYNDKFSKI